MILPTPRIVAIDDQLEDLDGLTKGLNQFGLTCLQFHFRADIGIKGIQPCPHVRVIFADLHLNQSVASDDYTQHFSLIGNLIKEAIGPSGPYVLILWTKYSDRADNLRQFLDERLENTPRPLAVEAIDKKQYLDGNGNAKSTENLITEITKLFDQQPQITALLGWEESVLGAAAETVSSIFNLAEEQNRGDDIGKLLAHLAVAAAGTDRVEQDRFRAVNEALLPILADHIASLPLRDVDDETWQAAFTQTDIGEALSAVEAAKLNSRVHIDSTEGIQGNDRGAVIALPDKLSNKFEQTFGLPQEEAATKQFLCREFVENNDRCRWILVQSQAACDYAQNQPGPLPYYLGLELNEEYKVKNRRPPEALWISPPFEAESNSFFLHINARFQVSLSPEDAKKEKPLYRLREQLLNDFIYRVHSYGARPGMISFRE